MEAITYQRTPILTEQQFRVWLAKMVETVGLNALADIMHCSVIAIGYWIRGDRHAGRQVRTLAALLERDSSYSTPDVTVGTPVESTR